MSARYLTAAVMADLGARLGERDWQVLRYVSDLRFVSGAQLTRLCFVDADDALANARAARRALARLIRLQLLARLPRPVGGVRSGSAGFVYYLGLAGQRLAVQMGWQPERRRRRSLSPGTLFLKHTLSVAELHTLLVEGDRSGRFELLELVAEPACWREMVGQGNQRAWLKPDSYVRLGSQDYEDSYFIEIDMGSVGSRAVETQLERYMGYHASGAEQARRGVFPRVLWLATSAERVGVIEASVQRLPADAQALFAAAPFPEALDMILQADG